MLWNIALFVWYNVVICSFSYKIKSPLLNTKFNNQKPFAPQNMRRAYFNGDNQTISIIPIKCFDIVFAEHIAGVQITNLFPELAANLRRLLGIQYIAFCCSFFSCCCCLVNDAFSSVLPRSNYVQLRCWSVTYKLFAQIRVIKCITFNSIHT